MKPASPALLLPFLPCQEFFQELSFCPALGHQGRRTGGTEFIYHSAEGRGGSQFRRVKERKRKGRHKDGEKRRGKSSCLRNCAVTAAAAAPYCSNALLRILPSCRHLGGDTQKTLLRTHRKRGREQLSILHEFGMLPPPFSLPSFPWEFIQLLSLSLPERQEWGKLGRTGCCCYVSGTKS